MIVDSSALVALALGEPTAGALVVALAASGQPLLFVGQDFTHTDLVAARY